VDNAQAGEQAKCCETRNLNGSADPSCSCSSDGCDYGGTVKRKTVNIAICLVVLLAVVGILVYKLAFSPIKNNDADTFTFSQFTIVTPQDTEAD